MSEGLNLDEMQAQLSLIGKSPSEKLGHAKSIIERLESEVSKLRSQLRQSELLVKKLQDSASLSGQNVNNTSSSFMLPSEFKRLYEVLIQEQIIDVFSGFLDDHVVFVQLIQGYFKAVLAQVQSDISDKVTSVLGLLGGDQSLRERTAKYLLKLLQDMSDTAFPKTHLLSVGLKVPARFQEELESMLESAELQEFINTVYRLGLHMKLSEPAITLSFPDKLEYAVFERAEDFYCVDGFPVKKPPCVVVLPAVMRGHFAYQAIKPAVLIIEEDQVPPLNDISIPRRSDLEGKENGEAERATPKPACEAPRRMTTLLTKRLYEAAKRIERTYTKLCQQ